MQLTDAMELYITVRLQRYVRPDPAFQMVRRYFPHLPETSIEGLTRLEVLTWHAALGRTMPVMANKCLSHLHSLYEILRDAGVYEGPNPTLHIKRFREYPRKRFVQPGEEMRRLPESLARVPVLLQAYFWVVLTTGCRRDEARRMRWTEVELTTGRWDLPKTKNGRVHVLWLPATVLALFAQLPRRSEWVFTTASGRPVGIGWVESVWATIRTRAHFPDIQIRDLRRTLASWLTAEGMSMQEIGQILNHASFQTTEWYLAGLQPGPAVAKGVALHTDRLLAHVTKETPSCTRS